MSGIKETSGTFEELLAQDGFLIWNAAGSSMRPLIREGSDYVTLTRPEGGVHPLDVIFYRRGRHYVLHRVMKEEPFGYRVLGDNCEAAESIRKDQVLAVMTELRRGGRQVKLNGFFYRMYLFFWIRPAALRTGIIRVKNHCLRAAL